MSSLCWTQICKRTEQKQQSQNKKIKKINLGGIKSYNYRQVIENIMIQWMLSIHDMIKIATYMESYLL